MHKILLPILALLFAIPSCKQDAKTGNQNTRPQANTTNLAGNWIALDYCSRAGQYGSALAAMNNAHLPYAFSLAFNPATPDSVEVNNGFERYSLPVAIRADTIELIGARQGKSIFLVFDSQGEKKITMFDATLERTQVDIFLKSTAKTKDAYEAFLTALNHHLFKGLFIPLRKGGTKGDVMFTATGGVQNMTDFNRYEVCTAGDCFVTGDGIDVITLSNSMKEASDQFFGFRYSAKNDTLTIYNLVNQNPEEKGAYTVGSIAYQFLRKEGE